jgi:tetratricopeptide (TPR) repeat protein
MIYTHKYEDTNMDENENTDIKTPETSAKKPVKKSLSREDIFRLDDEEQTIVDIIRDLNVLGISRMSATEGLVVRQAKREHLSERKAKGAISNLVKLGIIQYPEIYSDEYEACEEPYTGIPLEDISPELKIKHPWENISKKHTRKPLILEDVRKLDEEEEAILSLIKDLKKLEIQPTKELVIRQAKRANFSERRAKQILDTLYVVHEIRYTCGPGSDDDRDFFRVFPAAQYIEITSLEEDQEREKISKSHKLSSQGRIALAQMAFQNAGMSTTIDLDKALQNFEDAVQLDPKNKEAWDGKGRVLEALGRKKEAEAAFAKAASIEHEEETKGD